ncbi:MAG TPA: hypothetical protein PKV40_00080 [Candidatus Kapabacteria bacterium]|nr:hypothetical protein [Candidatus Kapabacteria bacterium]
MKLPKQVKNDIDLYEKVRTNLESVDTDFNEIYEDGLTNYNYYSGHPWTEEEIQSHLQQGRKPKVMNEIFPKIQHLIGVQMQTRMDIKAVGREVSDELASDILSYLIKWVEQSNNIKNIETDIFTTGCLTGVGFAHIYWDTNEVLDGYPKIEYVPFGEMYWDLYHTHDKLLRDAPWMCRVFYESRENLASIFPDFEDYILNEAILADEDVDAINAKRYIMEYVKYQDPKKELLKCYDYNEHKVITVWIVVDDIRGEIHKFDTKNEAKTYFETLQSGYIEQGIPLTLGDAYGTELLYMDKYNSEIIHQTIVIGDKVIVDTDLSITDYQYVPYFPYFWEGNFFSVVDNLKNPQDEINRGFSQWDHALGAQNKGVTLVNEALLKRGVTLEKVRRELSTTRPIIPVIGNAIQVLQDNPVNPQIFQTINFAREIMTTQMGGPNAMGLTENAAESGRAVEARAAAAGTGHLPVLEALRVWRLAVSERIVWYIQHCMSPRQIIRLIGQSKDLQYVNIDNSILDTLTEIKFDIVVDEAMQTQAMKEKYFTELLHFFQVVPMPPELTMPLLLEYTSLPETKKEEIRKYYSQYQQQAVEMAQQAKEQKIQEQVQTQVKKQILRDELKKSIGISPKEQESNVVQQLMQVQQQNQPGASK